MKDTRDLYLPLFYSYLDITKSLSNAEFGMLVRMLLERLGSNGEPSLNKLSEAGRIAYAFMLDGATRVIERGKKGSLTYNLYANNNQEPKRNGNFDPKDAFKKALERSYGKEVSERIMSSDT